MKTQEERWNVGLPSFKISLLIENSQNHMKEKDIRAWSNLVIIAGD